MLRSVVVGGCLLVAGVTIGALLVGHETLFKAQGGNSKDAGPLDRARRSVIKLLSDGDNTSAGGAVYTRWGRSQCPYGSSLVYKGIIGGGWEADLGASSEYVCLVEEPEWDKTLPGKIGFSFMLGTEFKAGDSLFNMENVIGATLVMIPGRKSCMTGWHTEYYGYLMSSKFDGKTQRNFICVDIAPEADRSGQDKEGGSELWPVEARCGHSLPCPTYERDKELTCVVCSKQT